MEPIDLLHSRFPEARPSGKGYKTHCPAHDDSHPSLSFGQDENGDGWVKCFSGCPSNAVLSAVGLTQSQLRAKSDANSGKKQPTPRCFATPQEAIAAYGWGEPAKQWPYHDAIGKVAGYVCRWNLGNGKEIRPVSLTQDGWVLASPLSPRPLFSLPALAADSASVVYVVEGEKKVDALTSLGFLGTTSMGGAKAAQQSDWSVLAGRSVVILPDNDEPGVQYATNVEGILRNHRASVRIVTLPGLAKGGDVADLLEQCTTDDERQALRNQISSAADTLQEAANETSGNSPHTQLAFQPFPVSTLPASVEAFVTETSNAIGCDPSFVALPVLTLLGAAVGNTRRLRLKSTYEVPAILWTGVVGKSGTAKSPALRNALSMAHERESLLQRQPQPQRFLVCDSTTEALAQLMASNPRGLLCVRDELAGWFASFDRYTARKGSCSADQSFFLSAYNGDPHTVDRRTGDQRHLRIERASLWVTGGIQPEILARAMGRTEREAGLLARLLLVYPPSLPQRWSDDEVSPDTKAGFDAAVAGLFGLEGEASVSLSPEAKQVWKEFHDRTAEEAVWLSADLTAAWSKFRDTALRIALIFHLTQADQGAVSHDTMTRAVSLTEWFKHETRRVYQILSETPAEQAARNHEERLIAFVKEKGEVTARDVERGPRCFRGNDTAEPTLQRLAGNGVLEAIQRRSTVNGGAPTTVYRLPNLCPEVDATAAPATQPLETRAKLGCVAVATSAGEGAWTKL
jgi:hypothetical protein